MDKRENYIFPNLTPHDELDISTRVQKEFALSTDGVVRDADLKEAILKALCDADEDHREMTKEELESRRQEEKKKELAYIKNREQSKLLLLLQEFKEVKKWKLTGYTNQEFIDQADSIIPLVDQIIEKLEV